MDTLPVEIFLIIRSHLSDAKDRFRLLQVCRRWRNLFIELEYEEVYVEGYRIKPLTELILANPRIGAAIRYLSVKWRADYDDYPQVSEIDDAKFEAIMAELGIGAAIYNQLVESRSLSSDHDSQESEIERSPTPPQPILADSPIGAAICDPSVKGSLYSDHDSQESESEGEGFNFLPKAVQELVRQISTSPEERRDWMRHLQRGNEEAWIALLLASVPNLIVLSGDYAGDMPRVMRVVARAARREPPFNTRPALQRLETLYIFCEDPEEAYPYWHFLPFFHLPSLRDVNLGAVNGGKEWLRPDDPAVRPAPGTSPVESLTLEYYGNGRRKGIGAAMAEYITSCANLKQFTYQYNDHDTKRLYIDFEPRKLYRALLTQKHSLEVLHLCDDGILDDNDRVDLSDDEDGPQAYNRWFGSLAEFSQLYDLGIRVPNLLNYHDCDQEECVVLKDILPPSLGWLYVSDCEAKHCAALVPNLQGVVHHKKQFPNLEEIRICFLLSISRRQAERSYYLSEEVPAPFEELFLPVREMCDRAGIRFKMVVDVGRFRTTDT